MRIKLLLFFASAVFGEEVKREPRIVGGVQAGMNEYPYFILWNGCASSLIHGDVALSAAHVSLWLAWFMCGFHSSVVFPDSFSPSGKE